MPLLATPAQAATCTSGAITINADQVSGRTISDWGLRHQAEGQGDRAGGHADARLAALTWWSHRPAGTSPWGLVHEQLLTQTNGAQTNGARPLEPGAVSDRDGAGIDSKLVTRAFKRGDTDPHPHPVCGS